MTDTLDELIAPDWFSERGGFWGTANQLCFCARCGRADRKGSDEPRHYSGIFTPRLHLLCDSCFERLDKPGAALRARQALTQEKA